ncbi:nuclear transport factor 2 family protein [Nocardia miyunensis]|uniref:nuclear transport factor 2 family protein n=1 Tax=Nocardia miyunensis TaxID=282684 RepID=UPI00082BCC00|nr:nuclear transport factor 2 family protein [Nocardia miyunensis]
MDDALARLEQRLQRVEDELAVLRLLTSYGPLADAGSTDAAELWSEDGEYDVDGWRMRGRDEVRDMIRSDAHQRIIGTGSAHFFGPPSIDIDGDEAVAVCQSILVRHNDDGCYIWRAGAHRIRLRRTAEGWRIAHRISRPLDGSEATRQVLTGRDD